MAGKKVALVTGIAGFCGSHLAELLLRQGYEVAGVDLAEYSTTHLDAACGDVRFYRADLQDVRAMRRILAEVQPDQIYHLAGLTRPPSGPGWRDLLEANVYGTVCLLEAVLAESPDAAVLIAGSAAQYGFVPPEENPIREETPFRPVTPYGVSKVAQELTGYLYGVTTGLRIIRTRAFNLMGPRQGAHLAGSAFARQIAAIEAGRQEPVLVVGNLTSQRDFLDVRDAVRAYLLALEHGEPGVAYNVCSGRGRTVAEVLEGLLALSTVPNIAIRQDPALLQTADVPAQVGDYRRLHECTGWEPQIPFAQTLQDLLDDWRHRLEREP